jgi:RHS repeat-associated protein
VAVREGSAVYATVGDHLGSVTVLAQGGSVAGATRYLPYGTIRLETGVWPTDRRFTGQRWEQGLGLYDYRARFYDPTLGRFLQPDPLVPELGNPQALNRYAYVYSNPLRYTDPSGHAACIDEGCALLAPPGNPRPFLRVPAPRAITFIHREMVRNAQSKIAIAIHMANAIAQWPLCPGCVLGGKTLAFTLWTSQVMDARVKNYTGPLAPWLGNWDHKPILYPRDPQQQSPVPEIPERKGWSTVGSSLYLFDIWSNIHYGYVGRASGFSQSELTGGAGIEQIGSDLVSKAPPHRSPGADNWLASWDHPSDNEAIRIGIRLWDQYGLAVKPADLYLAVLEAPRLVSQPLGGTP